MGTLDFTQTNQARKCNSLCLAILQSEHVKKFLFTPHPIFFIRPHTRETGGAAASDWPAAASAGGGGQIRQKKRGRLALPWLAVALAWPAGASSGMAAVAAGSGAGRAAHRRPKTRARVRGLGRLVATESRGRAGALAWPAAVNSGLAVACASSNGSSNLARRQWQPWPWRPRQQSRGGRRRARGSARESSGARLSILEGAGTRQGGRGVDARGSEAQQWWPRPRTGAAR